MKILLVEPNYKNKYPPMGLMKISTYHKTKGDYVLFHKGLLESSNKWDRIYITSLFTFDYKKVVEAINYYKKFVKSIDDIYLGGIAASLMPEDFKNDTGINNVHIGTLDSSNDIGFSDDVNIDMLPLDYGILYDVDYEYPAGDNYFGYTTRGCVNKCKFCAVPILEKNFKYTNNIKTQVLNARAKYGDKKDLLLLDNNILGLPVEQIKCLVDDLISIGFGKEATFLKESVFEKKIRIINYLENEGKHSISKILDLWNEIIELQKKRIAKKKKEALNEIIDSITNEFDDTYEGILFYKEKLKDIFKSATRRFKSKRYVDFNQGLDAREIIKNPEKVKLLSKLPLRPFRVAFDSIAYKDIYTKAILIARENNITYFSNYILYNFEDKPIELWHRLRLNINLAKNNDCNIYSFPMKYAPISQTHRKFVGKNWTRYYLSAVRAILNVTKGVVANGEEFFYRAFGKSEEEYMKILHMPKDFIVYRNHFEENGLTEKWEKLYEGLSEIERREVVEYYFSTNKEEFELNSLQKEIYEYYKIRY